MMRLQDVCTEGRGPPGRGRDWRGIARARAFQARVGADLVNVF
jgi:hypothetical protein